MSDKIISFPSGDDESSSSEQSTQDEIIDSAIKKSYEEFIQYFLEEESKNETVEIPHLEKSIAAMLFLNYVVFFELEIARDSKLRIEEFFFLSKDTYFSIINTLPTPPPGIQIEFDHQRFEVAKEVEHFHKNSVLKRKFRKNFKYLSDNPDLLYPHYLKLLDIREEVFKQLTEE